MGGDELKKHMSNTQNPMSKDVSKRLTDLKSCIEYLEKTCNLVRIKSAVSTKYELAAVAKKFEGRKCVLFERVKNSKYPVCIGLLWNRDIVGSLFGVPKEEVPFVLARAIGPWQTNKNAFPSLILEKGPANEVIEEDVNLFKLPVPVHALKDGGRYFDSSLVVVNNPETGVPNISIHRMMVTAKDRITFLIDIGRHLGDYFFVMEKRNKPLKVTINNGIGLVPWLVSSIQKQGDGKYGIANHIVGRPIHFMKAQRVDVPAYADAQFVIEAEILPNTREMEGPFAEVTGYYASRDERWVMRVLAVTHQKKPYLPQPFVRARGLERHGIHCRGQNLCYSETKNTPAQGCISGPWGMWILRSRRSG